MKPSQAFINALGGALSVYKPKEQISDEEKDEMEERFFKNAEYLELKE